MPLNILLELAMKRLYLSFLLLSLALLLIAQPFTEVRKAQSIRYDGLILNSPIAGNWVFWTEQDADYQLLAMQYNSLGHALSSDPMSIELSEGPFDLLQVEASSDGNVILLYQKQIDGYRTELRMQKINAAGQLLWQDDGIPLCQNLDHKFPDARICANNSGGAYAVFFYDYDDGYIYRGVNIDNSGNNIWTANPDFLIDQAIAIEQLLLDDAQNLIINISKHSAHSHIFKVDSSGNVIGSNPMYESTAAIPYNARICRGSDGRMLLYSNCDFSSLPMQLQMVDTNGDLIYDEPLEVFMSDGYISKSRFEAQADGGYFCSYLLTYATGVLPFAVISARFNSNLEQVWGESLNVVYGDEQAIIETDMLLDTEGEGWITCLIRSDYDEYEQKLFKVDSSGTVSSPDAQLSSDMHKKKAARIIRLDNLMMLVWQDYQGDQVAIKRQIFATDATALLPPYGLSLSSKLSGTTYLSEFHSLGNRGICIWDDNRNSHHKLYYQVLDQNLNPLFAVNGLELPMDSDDCQIVTAAVSPQNTLACIVKSINQDGSSSFYMQEIDANGNILYPGNGVHINQSDLTSHITLSFDGEARLIYWIEYLSNPSYQMIVKGQKIISGVAAWGSEGICVYNVSEEDIEDIVAAEDYLLVRVQNRGTSVRKVQALLLQDDGSMSPGWPDNGLKVLDDEFNSYLERIHYAGLIGDDLYCVIGRQAVDGVSIVVQKVSPSGEFAWGNSGLTIVASNEIHPDYIGTLISDAIYQAYYLPNQGSFLQKIDLDANLLFGTQGISLPGYSVTYINNPLQEYDNGNISFIWLDYLGNSEFRLQNTYIHPDGEILETQDIRTSQFYRVLPAMINDSCIILSAESQYDMFSWDEEELISLYAFSLPAPLAIGDPVAEATPAVLLLQNYPNPFKNGTTIDCKAALGEPVELKIYNLKGQLITKFEANAKADGEYRFTWDGLDSRGNLCAAGMYLYKVRAGKYSASRKMILLK